MRVFAFVLGGLLLIAGASAVVIADQEREAAVEQARADLLEQQQRLAGAIEDNRVLAGTLSALRETIAEQGERLADTEGFLQ
ncbi:hypothetical protein [Microbacterium tumbae]